jgi:hypothetical protein
MATATNTLRRRFREGLVAALRALELTGFTDANIESRRIANHRDFTSPSIVVAAPRIRSLSSPAGLRFRQLSSIVSVQFVTRDGNPDFTQGDQEDTLETIEAAFHLPRTLPAALIAIVPNVMELRVLSSEAYNATGIPYNVDTHRLTIACETWQTAGVAT